MKYLATIKSITQEVIEADNIKQARDRAEEIAEDLGSMDIGPASFSVKKIKEQCAE